MGSPASHIMPLGILAPSMQLHCFQPSYDGAKMGIWCRVLVGEDVPMPASSASLLSWALPGRGGGICARQVFEPCRDAELDVALSWICAVLRLSARSPVGVSMWRGFSARQ